MYANVNVCKCKCGVRNQDNTLHGHDITLSLAHTHDCENTRTRKQARGSLGNTETEETHTPGLTHGEAANTSHWRGRSPSKTRAVTRANPARIRRKTFSTQMAAWAARRAPATPGVATVSVQRHLASSGAAHSGLG